MVEDSETKLKLIEQELLAQLEMIEAKLNIVQNSIKFLKEHKLNILLGKVKAMRQNHGGGQ